MKTDLERAKTMKGFLDRFKKKGYTEEIPRIIEFSNDLLKCLEYKKKLYATDGGKMRKELFEAIKILEEIK